MRSAILILLPLMLLACSGDNSETSLGRMGGAPPSLILNADLIGIGGARLGDVTLTEELQGDRIVIRARGFPEGRLPVSLHAVAQCSGGDFEAAGPPLASLPPLEAESSGVAELFADLPLPRLRGAQGSWLDSDGLSIIVQRGDQRIACAALRYGGKTGAIDGD